MESDDVAALVNGCLNVMRYLKMLPGSAPPNRTSSLDREVTLASEQAGMFYPLVRRGSYVEQGMKVG